MATDEDNKKLHIAMFPWLAFGHMIPYLDLAKKIAEKGHKISYISTPRNIARLPKIPPHVSPLLNFVQLPLPPSDNLPPDAESTNDIPLHKIPYLKAANDGLEQGVAHFLETCRPDWIFYDFAPYWLPPIAATLCISQAYFSAYWALSLCFFAPSTVIHGDDPRSKLEDFTVSPPWIPFPSKVALRLHEAKKLAHTNVNESGVSDSFRVASALAGCEVLVMRGCLELEHQWLNLLGELYQKEVVPVGLLPPSAAAAAAGGDDDHDETWLTVKEWLERQEKGSVVYVAFGSEVSLSQEELNELALGLELSGIPFFWTVRKQQMEDNSIVLPDGFEERTEGRGVVWTGWVPQIRMLAHESVGGFLTHCGWGSVIEGLAFGRPLIMLPIHLDQGLVARFFGEEKEAGIEIPRNEEDGSFTSSSVGESLRLIMVGERGQNYRDNAKELMKIFRDENLHNRYVDNFVKYLQNQRRESKKD